MEQQAPYSKKQVFQKLSKLDKAIQYFKEHNQASLTAEEVQILKDVYESVNVFSLGQMPTRFNTHCSECVREAFQVFVSVYDRMYKDSTINGDAPIDLDQYKAGDVDYSDQINPPVPVTNGLKGAANETVNLTPEQIKDKELAEIMEARKAQLHELGFVFNELDNSFGKEGLENVISVETLETQTKPEFETMILDLIDDNEPAQKIEGATVVPPAVVVPEQPKTDAKPLAEGVALNTAATLTPAQKAAQTKAKNAALKGAANTGK